MIVEKSNWTNPVIVDLERPNITSDFDREFWRTFNLTIENSLVPIRINPMYPVIKDILKYDGEYLGCGFKYEFAFENEEQRDLMRKELKVALPMENWSFYFSDWREAYHRAAQLQMETQEN